MFPIFRSKVIFHTWLVCLGNQGLKNLNEAVTSSTGVLDPMELPVSSWLFLVLVEISNCCFVFFFIQSDNDADSSSHKDDFGENQLVHGDLGENQLVDSASHEDLGNNQFVTYSESHEEDLGENQLDNDGKQEVLTKTSPEIFEMSDD